MSLTEKPDSEVQPQMGLEQINNFPSSDISDGGSNLWRVLEAIALRRKFVLSFVALATLLAVIISFVLPEKYRASALLLPPKENRFVVYGDGGAMADWASITAGLNLPVMATPSDVYVRILRSRNLANRILDSFGLIIHYEASSRQEALLELDDNTDHLVTDEGLIEIRFSDENPQLAAAIVNGMIVALDEINSEIFVTRTAQTRKFLEDRIGEAKSELDSARELLRRFQEKNRTIDLDRQITLVIETASQLKSQLALAEVDLSVKARFLSNSHPDVVELTVRVNELKRKVSELETGTADTSYFSLPVSDAPRLSVALAELITTIRVAEKLYENLALRLDEARIQEKNMAPVLSIVDRATPPEIRYWPQRTLIVAGTFGVSIVLAVMLALFLEYLRLLHVRNPEDFRRATFFFNTVSSMIPGRKKDR
ncbi:MAG: hypothetical protein IIB00_10510 [candidate division Zixibacteria bacterium]|nr:hypothetical protein [candidate division Zixibacteria bacterium]